MVRFWYTNQLLTQNENFSISQTGIWSGEWRSTLVYGTYSKQLFKGLDARERVAPPEYLYKGFCLFYRLARSRRSFKFPYLKWGFKGLDAR